MYHRTPNSLIVDVSSVNTPQQLHDLLFEAFQFPHYYGGNWDAFDDCIRDAELPAHIQVAGLEVLRDRLPREADFLNQCVTEFADQTHHDVAFTTA